MDNKLQMLHGAQWISTVELTTRHPILGKNISLHGSVKSACLQLCGVGLFEAYVNGQKVGSELLTPLFSDYNTCLQVYSYDVSSMLEQGNNILEIWLGNGWYKGRFGLDLDSNNYGSRFAAIAALEVFFADGTCKTICTDTSWKCRLGPVLESGIYDGETQDYSLPHTPHELEVIAIDKGLLQPRTSLPVVVHEQLKVQAVLHTPAGETVLDFGQNFAGWVQFHSSQPAGSTVTLDFGEALQGGSFFNANYRTANARFSYTSDGKERLVRPHFTYYGFRYVRVSGWEGELSPDDFAGCVIYSDIKRSGWFNCGNEKINRLYENALWSLKSNFVDLPTDCPQRDERLGWTGDAQVISKVACISMDCKAFFEKYLADLRTEQQRFDGAVPNYIPNIGFLGGACSVWGDAATILPMNLYDAYGDVDLLQNHYPMMQDWLGWITRQDKARGEKHLYDFGFHFGDWLAQDGVTERSMKGGTDDGFIASVYYCHSARLTSKAAKILGKTADSQSYMQLAEKIETAIFREYFTPAGRLSIDTQAAYIICLHFSIYPNKDVIVRDLQRRFERDNWKIKCGFVGAPLLCQTLAANGMQREAMLFLMNEGFPGWLYCVNLGATTIWERWNSLLPDGSCNGTDMNSLNHYAYGSVAEYLYSIAGLTPAAAGWSAVNFRPLPDIRLGCATAQYNSANGRWESEWKINQDGTLSVRFVVPEGCTAQAFLPFSNHKVVSLQSGEYENTYTPTQNLQHPYSADTLLMEMLHDERVVDIIHETLPQVAGMLIDAEAGNWTLNTMQHMGFLQLTPEAVRLATEQILELGYARNRAALEKHH